MHHAKFRYIHFHGQCFFPIPKNTRQSGLKWASSLGKISGNIRKVPHRVHHAKRYIVFVGIWFQMQVILLFIVSPV